MVKKLTLLAMAVAAVAAFAVPAMASAAPSLTMPAGTLVPVGTGVTGVSTNTVTSTPLGNLTCANVTVKATVNTNSGSSVAASATPGGATGSTCFLGKNAIEITNIELTSLTSTVSGKGTAVLAFDADLPGELTCEFESAGSGTPVTYTAGSSSLHLAGELAANPEICGEEGEVFIEGDYSLSTTSGGGAVILD